MGAVTVQRRPRDAEPLRDCGERLVDGRVDRLSASFVPMLQRAFAATSGSRRVRLQDAHLSPDLRTRKPRFRGFSLVERTGIEPVTFGLQSRRSPS
jgi:hypothetical protein